MAVQEVEEAGCRPSALTSLRARLREITDWTAYRQVAAQTRYPVGAMLASQTLMSFGVAATLSRSLGARHYGEYAVIITVAGLLQLVAAFPVESGLPRFLAEARQEQPAEIRTYYVAGLLVRLAAGVIATALGAFAAHPLSDIYGLSGMARPVFMASLSLCLLTPVSSFFLACVQGMEQPARWATGNLVSSLLVVLLTVAGTMTFRIGGQAGLFVCIAAGWLGAATVCACLARRSLGFLLPARVCWSRVGELLSFILPIWVVPLVGFGTRVLLKSYLAVECGAVPVGQFEIALTLLTHMGMIYQACMIVFIPAWTRLYAGRQGSQLLRSTAQARGALLGTAVFYGSVLLFAGQWVVPALFGSDQMGAVPAVRVMGLTMPIMISGWVASSTNIVSNRTRNIGTANVVWFLVAVPLGIVLTPALGALGTAIAWCTAYCVFAWFYISRARPFFREVEGWVQTDGRAGAAAYRTPANNP
jgi:O-antigen/teichoic acid export membrane protein